MKKYYYRFFVFIEKHRTVLGSMCIKTHAPMQIVKPKITAKQRSVVLNMVSKEFCKEPYSNLKIEDLTIDSWESIPQEAIDKNLIKSKVYKIPKKDWC